MKKIGIISFNAPIILTITLMSLVILLLSILTGGAVGQFFSIFFTRWSDPVMYLRLFTHVLVHQDLSHFTGNFLYILAVGPPVEEKYGSLPLAIMVAATALVTGLVNIVFFKNVMLMGASGVVFMLILLASFTNIREGRLPLTVLLVAMLFIGNEILTGLMVSDNISRISHVVGGLCGAGFGLFFHGGTILGRKTIPPRDENPDDLLL